MQLSNVGELSICLKLCARIHNVNCNISICMRLVKVPRSESSTHGPFAFGSKSMKIPATVVAAQLE